MKIYLDEKPDSSEAIEFLCLGEGGEVTHYEGDERNDKRHKGQEVCHKSEINTGRGEKTPTVMYKISEANG